MFAKRCARHTALVDIARSQRGRALLYIATFGSLIGFSFAFGQVLQINYLASGQTAAQASLHAAEAAFLGPLLGSLARVYGGRLFDRLGGGRVTMGILVGMIVAAGLLVAVSAHADHTAGPAGGAIMAGYVAKV